MPSTTNWRIYRYADSNGVEPFTEWLLDLDHTIQRRIRVALAKLEAGNSSSLKWLGGNVGELRIDIGPGYRIYITRQGRDGLVLLGGGDKSSQEKDIHRARELAKTLKE